MHLGLLNSFDQFFEPLVLGGQLALQLIHDIGLSRVRLDSLRPNILGRLALEVKRLDPFGLIASSRLLT